MTPETRFAVISVILAVAAAPLWAAAAAHVNFPPADAELIKQAASDSHLYYYTHNRSAHTTGAHYGGRTVLLALASYSGDKSADKKLLAQIRNTLKGENCLVAAGGYGSQHERLFTASCVLIKLTPRLWDQLTSGEKNKMDLLMKAAMVASAYTTSDAGAEDGKQNSDLLGGHNLNRGWNPNFREGMIGMMMVGTVWMGGADATYDFLDNYDHRKFTRQLKAAGLDNTYKTFNAAEDGDNKDAPEGRDIERDIKGYRIHGVGLDNLMKIYYQLTTHTYGGVVSPGVNDGKGYKGGGKIVSGAEDLPNLGKKGMLFEFNTHDANGPRSSITYSYTGFRPNLINQLVLIAGGYWQPGEMADECIELMKVGITDLYYKLEHGYKDYYRGQVRATYTMENGWDFVYMRSLWNDILLKYHQQNK